MFCVTVGSSTSKAEPKNCVAKVIGKPATATIVWIAVSGNHRWRGGRCVANHAHHIIHSALTGSRSPAGPRRLGTATRISASLSRRLSASFWRTPGQDPKAAKFAVLIPGHAGFPNRVKRSEGSDTTPTHNATCLAVCALVCDLSPKAECVPAFACESKRGPFVREVEKRDEKRFRTALWR